MDLRKRLFSFNGCRGVFLVSIFGRDEQELEK